MPITVDKLNYSYMAGSLIAQSALKDVTFTINDGEFLGIIGHTGSGKSTLVQQLNGLLQPASGRVTVDGFDMNDKKQRLLGRRLVGVVFQYPEYQLFEETVAKDVAYGPKNMGLDADEIALRVDEALRLVGLLPEYFAEKSPFELSGGEKRRAALAGIFAMRPKYLVLDEPMAGLDPLGRRIILDAFERLRERTGCAVVMVSHSMDDVARSAQRVMVLSGGRVAKLGAADEVFRDVKLLISTGLDVPAISHLAIKLREGGIDVPEGIYKREDMEKFILGRIKGIV